MKCECADHGCPVHKDRDCTNDTGLGFSLLFRVDMKDETGTTFCSPCADDALHSGLFAEALECPSCGEVVTFLTEMGSCETCDAWDNQ